jgi:hypothetical protein
MTSSDMAILREVRDLCEQNLFDEAIEKTNEIKNRAVSTHAHILCMEWEESARRKNSLNEGKER